VIRFFKLCCGLAAFVAFAWFGSTVKIGPRTLFEHLHAIGQTKESQDLVDSTKQAAGPLVDGVRRRITGAPAPVRAPDAGAPEDDVPAADRHQLRRVIGAAEHHAARRATP
jgi:hypothetical protein